MTGSSERRLKPKKEQEGSCGSGPETGARGTLSTQHPALRVWAEEEAA